MLEIVDSRPQPLPNLPVAEGMGRNLPAVRVRLADNRRHLLRRQLFGVEDLDPVNALVDQLPGLRPGVGGARDVPRLHGVRVASLRERRPGHVQGGSWNLSAWRSAS